MMETAKFNQQEIEQYEQYLKSLKAQMDNENIRKYYILQGKRKAKKKERLRLAKNFKQNGVSIELIKKCTGLTMKQIQRL